MIQELSFGLLSKEVKMSINAATVHASFLLEYKPINTGQRTLTA